jgi:murein DD-endopeptidase MepM/ murein hydrolase activator NlpD
MAVAPIRKAWIVSRFGDPRADHLHQGIDFAAPEHTPVFAIGPADVKASYKNGALDGYGNTIILEHAPNAYSLYAHLSEIFVIPGELVNEGQTIGAVGTTAAKRDDPAHSVGAHLHFEMLTRWPPRSRYSDRVDPERILEAAGAAPVQQPANIAVIEPQIARAKSGFFGFLLALGLFSAIGKKRAGSFSFRPF